MRGAALEPMLGQCYVNVDLFGAFLGAMSSPCWAYVGPTSDPYLAAWLILQPVEDREKDIGF